MVELSSDVTIGNFHFRGVHAVRIKRSMLTFVDTASIIIPSISMIKKNGTIQAEEIITGKQFKIGDKVVIKLGYDGELKTEFEGYVKSQNLEMPLVVECEGYSYQLRYNKNAVTKNYKKISTKDLLGLAVKGTDIEVECAADMDLYDLKMVEANGEDICNIIKEASKGALTIFFKNFSTLWCGLAYTSIFNGNNALNIGDAKYRLGWNIIKDNGLKEKVNITPTSVTFGSIWKDKRKVFTKSQVKAATTKLKATLKNIRDEKLLQNFADEKEAQLNYTGYEGQLQGFLIPYCQPGYSAYITDSRYQERDGTYLVESTELSFGINGGRRNIEIAKKI